MSVLHAWVAALSLALPVARREAVMADARRVVASVAKRCTSRRHVERHLDAVESDLLYLLLAKGLPPDLAASRSEPRLRRYLWMVAENRLNHLYRAEQRERAHVAKERGEPEVEGEPGLVDAEVMREGQEARLDGYVEFGAAAHDEVGDEPDGSEASAPVEEEEASPAARLGPVLATVRRGLGAIAAASSARGNEARARQLSESFEELLAVYFGRTTKAVLLAEQGIARSALDQRHKRVREAAGDGLQALLEARKITKLQASRGQKLLDALVLVQR